MRRIELRDTDRKLIEHRTLRFAEGTEFACLLFHFLDIDRVARNPFAHQRKIGDPDSTPCAVDRGAEDALDRLAAIGCLLLVHQLYTAWPARERDRVALLLGALAAMWTYDFTLYLIGYFAPPRVTALYALRGLLMAVLAGVIAIGLRRDLGGRVQLSRTLTVQSLSAFAIALYVVLIVAVAVLIEMIAGPYARVIEIGAVFFAAVSALVLLPSPRLQALWRVQVAKHFFQHRYDYRTEWMRFGETIGRPGEAPAPLGQRVAKAVADITQSPGAILLLRDDAGGLGLGALLR